MPDPLAAKMKHCKNIRRIVSIFLLLVTFSCVSRQGKETSGGLMTSDFYSEVISATKSYNDTVKSRIILQHKSFNPTKAIFKKFSSELVNSKHLIYLFMWENNLPTVTNNFKAIVVDKTSGKAFYAFKSENDTDITFTTVSPNQFLVEDFVITNYSSNRIDFLKGLQNKFSSAEMGQDYIIYEVDLANQIEKVTKLSAVTVDKEELTRLKGS